MNNATDRREDVTPADMDLVDQAFRDHWRHDGGSSLIDLSEFRANDIDAYIFNGSLYYSDGELAWSIPLEYLD